jgi:hypothetical protein
MEQKKPTSIRVPRWQKLRKSIELTLACFESAIAVGVAQTKDGEFELYPLGKTPLDIPNLQELGPFTSLSGVEMPQRFYRFIGQDPDYFLVERRREGRHPGIYLHV